MEVTAVLKCRTGRCEGADKGACFGEFQQPAWLDGLVSVGFRAEVRDVEEILEQDYAARYGRRL
jgi:hypothetical protein